MEKIRGYYLKENYGIDELPMEQFMLMGEAILAVMGADGISEKEMQHCIEFGRAMGATDEMLESFKSFDPHNLNLDEILKKITFNPPARALLYDIIKLSRVDGFSSAERSAMNKVARALKVDDATVSAIEALIKMEDSLREARIKILFPNAS